VQRKNVAELCFRLGTLTTSNSENPHNAYYRWIDINEVRFHFFQNNSDNGQNHDSNVQLIPSATYNSVKNESITQMRLSDFQKTTLPNITQDNNKCCTVQKEMFVRQLEAFSMSVYCIRLVTTLTF